MTPPSSSLISEIESFLSETGMGASYFGKRSVGNSELVTRLRGEGRVWPETADRAREFMRAYRAAAAAKPQPEAATSSSDADSTAVDCAGASTPNS